MGNKVSVKCYPIYGKCICMCVALVEDERIQESNIIGGGDPRDRFAGDLGAKSTQPDAHSRMRVDWNNDRVQRAKKLENQLVAALLKEN